MKSKNLFQKIFVVVSLLIFAFACKDSVTEPPLDIISKNYFPDSDGTYFYYNSSVSDSTGLISSGERRSYFTGDTILLLTPYHVRTDTFELDGTVSDSRSYFRKSSSGVFGYFDTTGVTAIVPDSLRNLISLNTEYRLLFFPLAVGQTWPVYNISVDFGIFRIDIVRLSAEVISKDSIELSFRNISITKEVFNVKYDLIITAGSDGELLTFQANAWIMEDIGFYRWSGDSELLNFFTGENIYPLETVIMEELTEYNIQ